MDHGHRLIATSVVVVLVMCALGGVVLASDDSDAAGSGTQDDPYDSFSGPIPQILGQTLYFYVGSSVTIYNMGNFGLESVTDGFGLTLSGNTVSGTISKTGTITVTTNSGNITLIVVEPEA